MAKPPKTHAEGRPRIGIVVADFNAEVTAPMLKRALEAAAARKVPVTRVVHVPGSFDVPLALKRVLSKGDVDAGVVLGAIIQGETGHDELIARVTADWVARLSVETGKPVALGITGPRMTDAQATARIPVGKRAVEAAILQWKALEDLRKA
ncbi:MAG: 6,7-dimethyl-8-ribityllumazine synthase [Methanobacteriota archaeon]